MVTRTRSEINTTEDVITILETWSGLSVNDGAQWLTGVALDDNYIFPRLHENFQYPEHRDNTRNVHLPGASEKYRQLGSWLEPTLESVMNPISVSSVIDVIEADWSHHARATVDIQTADFDQMRDVGSTWQAFEADILRVDNRNVTTRHDPAEWLDFPDPGTLAEVIQLWLNQFYEDERVDLLAETLAHYEVEQNLQKLENGGAIKLADRFRFLLSGDAADDDDDMPLSAEAALGFFDFIGAVEYEDLSMSATCAFGRLCTQWKYDDGRSLVLWFDNRTETSLTAFGSDRKLLKDIGRDDRAARLTTAVNLLVEAKFFICRNDPSG